MGRIWIGQKSAIDYRFRCNSVTEEIRKGICRVPVNDLFQSIENWSDIFCDIFYFFNTTYSLIENWNAKHIHLICSLWMISCNQHTSDQNIFYQKFIITGWAINQITVFFDFFLIDRRSSFIFIQHILGDTSQRYSIRSVFGCSNLFRSIQLYLTAHMSL